MGLCDGECTTRRFTLLLLFRPTTPYYTTPHQARELSLVKREASLNEEAERAKLNAYTLEQQLSTVRQDNEMMRQR